MRLELRRLVPLAQPWRGPRLTRLVLVAESCAEGSGKSSVAGVRGGLGSWPALGC